MIKQKVYVGCGIYAMEVTSQIITFDCFFAIGNHLHHITCTYIYTLHAKKDTKEKR